MTTRRLGVWTRWVVAGAIAWAKTTIPTRPSLVAVLLAAALVALEASVAPPPAASLLAVVVVVAAHSAPLLAILPPLAPPALLFLALSLLPAQSVPPALLAPLPATSTNSLALHPVNLAPPTDLLLSGFLAALSASLDPVARGSSPALCAPPLCVPPALLVLPVRPELPLLRAALPLNPRPQRRRLPAVIVRALPSRRMSQRPSQRPPPRS